MKYFFVVLVSALTMVMPFDSSEKDAIKEVVLKGYIHGAFNELNPEAMKEAFHKDFAILSTKGTEVTKYPIDKWAAGVEKRKNDPEFDPSSNVWEHNFAQIDVTENAAVVKVELFKDDKHVFTDYLSLYKFDSGDWKIVSKIYHRHK